MAVTTAGGAIRRPPKAVVVVRTLIWVGFAPVLNNELWHLLHSSRPSWSLSSSPPAVQGNPRLRQSQEGPGHPAAQ